MGEQVVGDGLHEQERNDRQVTGGRVQLATDLVQDGLALFGVAGPFDQRHDAVPADQGSRHPGHVTGAAQEAGPQQLVAGAGVGHLAPTALDHLAGVRQRVEGGQDGQFGQLVQRELELGDDAEVAAAAAQRPEQAGVLAGRGAQDLAVSGNDLRGQQAVDGQAEAAHQAADTTAEGEPGRAGVTHHAGRKDQAVLLSRAVDLAEQRPAADRGPLRLGVNPYVAELTQVDDEAVVADAVPGHRVPAAAHGDEQALGAGVANRGGYVRCRSRLGDQGRPAVVHGVPDGAGGIVADLVRADYRAGEIRDGGRWHLAS